MGMIYKRGEVYWIKYYRHGKPYRESCKSTKESDAIRKLKKREGEIAAGRLPTVYFDRIKFDELAEEYLRDYRLNDRKSLERANISVNHLTEFFGGLRVTDITTPRVQVYTEERMKSVCRDCGETVEEDTCPSCNENHLKPGASNATINRELAALKRMLNLAANQTPPRVDRVPFIPMLKENNIRKGFFEHPEFEALRNHLPEYLKGVVTFAYKTGWRLSEIITLKWSTVDLKEGIVRLEPGETKNSEGRTVYLDNELKEVFSKQDGIRKLNGKLSPWVFPGKDGVSRLKDFRGAWDKGCIDAKIGKRLFHDFRRTAVRNMIRAGIPERVAMMISGHRTRTVFDRYNIVGEDDLKQASRKQEIYLEDRHGHKMGTICESGENGRGTGKAQVIDIINGARGGI